MKKMKKYFLVLFVLFSSASLSGQNFNDALRLSEPGIVSNARALSMGNAYTAISNDLSAANFNPAGFALIRKLEFNIGLNYNNYGNNVTFLGSKRELSNNSSKLNQVGFVFPVATYRGSLSFALGYNQLKDFNRALSYEGFNQNNNSLIQDLTSYNDDIAFKLALSYPLYFLDPKTKKMVYDKDTTVIKGKLNQRGKTIQDGGINTWFFGGAIEVEKDIFVGGTINIISGEFNRNKEDFEEDIFNYYPSSVLLDPKEPASADFKSFYMNDIVNWDIAGWDAKLGVLAKLNEMLNLGITIQFPRTYTIKKTQTIFAESRFGNASFKLNPPLEEATEFDIRTPYEFTFGTAFKNKWLTLSADAKLIDYTSMELTAGLDKWARTQRNQDIKELFRTVLNFNTGAEYLLNELGLALRFGFIYMSSPFKDDPADYDKKYITSGFGYLISKNITLNVGYVYGWWKDFGDNYGSGIARTYQDITVRNLITSLNYSF